ncbi:replication protein [Paenibacillus donghaensis]|uniref:Bacteriophage lambda Replication protein O N-terminal domain-containing protein n=1 Tax=Paenibacillus donghaensis TaxID=414771 RepID=A0A2Z2K4Q3_9BACL|nr:replication protein [Paenibacillus donghaensis]ASA20906.1 hypothetical protein B9T62_08985 [Paenibacillus donghaensis]
MANPQPEDGYVKLANEIWNELIRRDFSKRQKDIILLIIRMSYGCRKKMASIPKLKDFEICGISPQNIKKELKLLVSSRVISWSDGNVFSVIKDYEQWQITPVSGWDEVRFKELLSLNLSEGRSKTSQNKKFQIVKPRGKIIYTSQNKKLILLKTRSAGFSKQEVKGVSNPCGCKAKRIPKDIIKNNIKDNSCCLKEDTEMNQGNQNEFQTISQDAVPAGDTDSNRKAADLEYRRQVTDLYLKRRAKGIDLTVKDEILLDQLIADGVPISVALDGINQAFDKYKPQNKRDEIKSLKYCEGIIYGLFSKQEAAAEVDTEKEDPEAPQSKLSGPPEPEFSQDEYQKKLEKLKAKRGVVV